MSENADKTDPSSPDPTAPEQLASRLSALPFQLSTTQVHALSRYTALFQHWNATFQFSKFQSLPDILDNLVFPSLAFGILLPPSGTLLDLGSGPGIPGIPIKLALPDFTVSLLEPRSRTAEFLHACLEELELAHVRVFTGRAESLAHDSSLRSSFDAVVARGFGPLPITLEVASGFLRPGGSLTVHCSERASSEVSAHGPAIARLGARFGRVGAIGILPIPDSPVPFVRFEQVQPPNKCYPRAWKTMKSHPIWPVDA